METVFAVTGLEMADAFDPGWTDAQQLCKKKGADVVGGVGPFGLWVLASGNLSERTAVFFRVFKVKDKKHVVLMCHDDSRSEISDHLLSSCLYQEFTQFFNTAGAVPLVGQTSGSRRSLGSLTWT